MELPGLLGAVKQESIVFRRWRFNIALYLQKALGFDLVMTGWIMSAITPGMILIQPLIGKFYNKIGPLPFIIPGLVFLSASTFAFALTNKQTPPYVLGLFVFCIGAASASTQTANVTSIFSSLPTQYKSAGSSLYSLFKQISASFGVAISTMVLSLGTKETTASSSAIYHYCFIVLGSIPLIALLFCFCIDNKKALLQVTQPSHIPTETEFYLLYLYFYYNIF